MKKNIFKFAMYNKAHPKIVSSKSLIPEWYKKSKATKEDIKNIKKLPALKGFKACMPFMDSLSLGYTAVTPVDIAVEQTPGGPSISWVDPTTVYLETREIDLNKHLPTPEGYHSNHYAWRSQFAIHIPKGYNCLFTHPFNRFDLPFLTLSGVVNGKFDMYGGNIPVFFNKTFEGVIPAGTPFAQILMFKDETWDSIEDTSIIEDAVINQDKSKNTAYGWYKKNIWKRKDFN